MYKTREKVYTLEEYLQLEKGSKEGLEFVFGNIITTPGESKIANKLAITFYMLLFPHLQEKGLECYSRHEDKWLFEILDIDNQIIDLKFAKDKIAELGLPSVTLLNNPFHEPLFLRNPKQIQFQRAMPYDELS